MRKAITGINRLILSGKIRGTPTFQSTKNSKTSACSFSVTSEREGDRKVVSCTVKVNAYGENLVPLVERYSDKGVYVIVEGELMNREVKGLSENSARPVIFTEIRAWNLIFITAEGVRGSLNEDEMDDELRGLVVEAASVTSAVD